MTDSNQIIRQLQPHLNPGIYCFCLLPHRTPVPVGTIGSFIENEGTTIIIPIEAAQKAGLVIGFQADWITLDVHSDLASVGLTAAVSGALAQAGISCNMVAGYHHDHLFVPAGKGQQALQVLQQLQAESQVG